MRILIFLFISFLISQSLTRADDIRDFQIEGMSIGDSALDYFNKKELEKRKKYYRITDSKEFYYTSISSHKFENYDNIMFHFKDNDSSFIIHGISAAIFFSKNGIINLDDCLNQREKVDEELNELKEAIRNKNSTDIQDELGDVFFTLVSIGRWYNINVEEGIAGTNQRFLDRFSYLEKN